MKHLILGIILFSSTLFTNSKSLQHYFSKRQQAIITNILLKNTKTKPVAHSDAHSSIEVLITYYTHNQKNIPHIQNHNNPRLENDLSTPHELSSLDNVAYKQDSSETPTSDNQSISNTSEQQEITPTQPVIIEPVPAPRLKTIHDVIKYFKNKYPLPEDNSVFFEIITNYFNAHWEYTFYATWKKDCTSIKETEILTKAFIYLAQAYGKETAYSFYEGYSPYSIAYLLENVCGLDSTSIQSLP